MIKLFRFCYLPAVLAAVMALAGCDQVQDFVADIKQGVKPETSAPAGPNGKSRPTTTTNPTTPASSSTPRHKRDQDTVTIASFNIQVFGQSKLKKAEVMGILADIARRFDLVAIQEIRSIQDNVIPDFVNLINADGSQYQYVVGERLGRTNSKEQYAFVYDATRIELVPNSIYTVADPKDLLHREPMVAGFRVRGPPAAEAFSFELVNIHTDPDETDQELDALGDVFTFVQRNNPNEDDVILLGDLNVNEKKLGKLGRLPNIAWTVSGAKTNTRGTKSYDNIVFDRSATVEYRGQWGVLNIMSEYNLSMDEALKVSDHLPVWAVFSIYENAEAPHVAGRPEPGAKQ